MNHTDAQNLIESIRDGSVFVGICIVVAGYLIRNK